MVRLNQLGPLAKTYGQRRGRSPNGLAFSLIELLVVMAIISILMAMYLPILSKVMSRAKQTAVREGIRQEHLGEAADHANIARPESPPAADREACRKAYRKTIEASIGPVLVTQPLYVVRNEAEFRAYWHTMINPSATGDPEYDESHRLLAKDPEGNEYHLPPIDDRWTVGNRYGNIPVYWEFLSTVPAEMSAQGIGIDVLYSDGHVEHRRIPGEFPAVRSVAELSHRFVQESGL